MNKNYTLKELVKVYAETYCQTGRDAGIKAVLDFIGYELPKDEEREAFDVWWKENRIAYCNEEHAFQLWKAGREELRKKVCSDKCEETKTEPEWWEPAWIPWDGGDKSPIPGKQTRYEVKDRDGVIHTCTQNNFVRGEHSDPCADIIAYRILD